MNRWTAGALIVSLGLLRAQSLLAHHSAVLFDLSRTFTMTGTMTKIDWRNPHVGVFVEVKNEAGVAVFSSRHRYRPPLYRVPVEPVRQIRALRPTICRSDRRRKRMMARRSSTWLLTDPSWPRRSQRLLPWRLDGRDFCSGRRIKDQAVLTRPWTKPRN
jgi:hypothetical protein